VKVPQLSAQPFSNRAEAGQLLAARFSALAGREEVIVLALPRGGVPIGYEVANALGVALDVFVVRKLGVPGHEELAMGAIASGDVQLLNHEVVDALGIPGAVIDQVAQRERAELERRERLYRGSRPPVPLTNKTVILVDDGLATGSTMRAAIAAVRRHQPASIVVGVPVGAPSTCDEIARDADEVVCLRRPEPFVAVGLWYRDFSETSDADVRALLGRNEQ
jgi:putative phosphoribosyl transferase